MRIGWKLLLPDPNRILAREFISGEGKTQAQLRVGGWAIKIIVCLESPGVLWEPLRFHPLYANSFLEIFVSEVFLSCGIDLKQYEEVWPGPNCLSPIILAFGTLSVADYTVVPNCWITSLKEEDIPAHCHMTWGASLMVHYIFPPHYQAGCEPVECEKNDRELDLSRSLKWHPVLLFLSAFPSCSPFPLPMRVPEWEDPMRQSSTCWPAIADIKHEWN